MKQILGFLEIFYKDILNTHFSGGMGVGWGSGWGGVGGLGGGAQNANYEYATLCGEKGKSWVEFS